MKLKISPDLTIGQIQAEFATFFPNLKPVFFTKPHNAYKGSPAKFIVSERETRLSTLSSKVPENAVLQLELDMSVWELEQHFENEYGLHMQVFRRSGNTWLETSVTDNLSLEQQEKKAEDSLNHRFEFVDPLDYREKD